MLRFLTWQDYLVLARAPRDISLPGVGCVGAGRGARAPGRELPPSAPTLCSEPALKGHSEVSRGTEPGDSKAPTVQAKKPADYTVQAGAGDRSVPSCWHSCIPPRTFPHPPPFGFSTSQSFPDIVIILRYEVETDLGRGPLHKVKQTPLQVRSSSQVLVIMILKKGTSCGSTRNKMT